MPRILTPSSRSSKKPHRVIFLPQTLVDLAALSHALPSICTTAAQSCTEFSHLVIASRRNGNSNFGGELALFSRLPDHLNPYLTTCFDLIHALLTACHLPIVTFAYRQGDAFRGGLQAAFAHDYIIATPTARFDVPESAFNAFPGMGAVSLLTRRLGAAQAQTGNRQGHYSQR